MQKLLLLLTALVLSGCSTCATAEEPAPATLTPTARCVGNVAPVPLPEVPLQRLEVQSSRHPATWSARAEGSSTWISVWASWCEPCKEELPGLIEFTRRHRIQLELLSLDDDPEASVRFLRESQLASSTLWLAHEAREPFFRALQLQRLPMLPFHLLFDPTPLLRCQIDGTLEASELEALLHRPLDP